MRLLQEILDAREWSELEAFQSSSSWASLTEEEKLSLARLFALYGEELLEQRDIKAFECFETSSDLAPLGEETLWIQIKALAKETENMRCQERAHLLLERLVSLDGGSFEAWLAWARVCMNRALFHSDLLLFQEASHHYAEAAKKLPKGRKPSFYREWGRCYYEMGLCSGESTDFHRAVEKYLRVHESLKDSSSFLLACGQALFQLALLLKKDHFFSQSIGFFLKSVERDSQNGNAWEALAVAYQELFTESLQKQHFLAACGHFRKALSLQKNSADLWVRFGRLQFVFASTYRDREQLENSLKAFAKAATFISDHPQLLCFWAEAESLYGLLAENLDVLKKAEAHAREATEISPEESEYWRVYGGCLVTLGHYFSDEQYYLLAIEKLCYGLSFEIPSPFLYSELAVAYLSLGILLYDDEVVGKSLEYFERAAGCEREEKLSYLFWNDWGSAILKYAEIQEGDFGVEVALDKFEKAISLLGKIEGAELSSPEIFCNYGSCLDLLGTFREDASYYERAVSSFSCVLKCCPKYLPALHGLAQSLFHLGNLVGDVDCFQRSLYCFSHVLKNDEENGEVWCDCGYVLLNYCELIKDPSRLDDVQWLLKQAEEKLLKALSLGSNSVLYHLACLYSIVCNYPLAMEFLQRAEAREMLPPIEELREEEWLDGLRQTPSFHSFFSRLESRQEGEIG